MRKVIVGKTMYSIFSSKVGKYVQPCNVTKVVKDGFYAQCHNGGDGIEFFPNDCIGNGTYFSKDTAELKLKEKE